MEVKDAAIEERCPVEHFDIEHQMTEEKITELSSLIVLSSTAFNIQNRYFDVVGNPELSQQIRKVSWDQAQVIDVSLTWSTLNSVDSRLWVSR